MNRESGEHLLVILGPPAEESFLDVVVEQPSDGECGPNVRQVIRSPNEPAVQKDWCMEGLKNLPPPAEEVERNREDGANKETPQKAVIDGTCAENLLRPESTPENGSGKESVDTRAGEMMLLPRRTDIGDLRHLVVEGSRAYESGKQGGEHLAAERDPGRDVDVMGKLEILSEVEGVRGGDVSVGLEVVHGCSITGEPEAAEQFSYNIEGDLYVGGGHDDTTRDTEDDSEEDAVQHNGRGCVSGVGSNTSGTDADGYTQYSEVDPLGDLPVGLHQASVDILGVGKG